jgi:hypothetical protein
MHPRKEGLGDVLEERRVDYDIVQFPACQPAGHDVAQR